MYEQEKQIDNNPFLYLWEPFVCNQSRNTDQWMNDLWGEEKKKTSINLLIILKSTEDQKA